MNKIDELLKNEEVEWKRLGEVAECFAGGTPKTSNKSYYDGDIPWIRSGEINFNIIKNSERNITQKGLNNSSAKLIKKNSVVLAMTGVTVGRVGVVAIETSSNQSVCAIETNEKIINYRYLYYYIANNYLNIKSMGQGALTSLNLSIIKNIIIPIPSLKTQEKIVKILDKFTKYITELQSELQSELQYRIQQYEYYRNLLLSEDYLNKLIIKLGLNSEEYKVKQVTLGAVAIYSKEKVLANQLDSDNYVGVENLLQNKGGKEKSNYVPKEGKFTRFKPNDILIGNIRPYLKKIWLSNINGGTNGDVLVIRLKENVVLSKFLYYVLSSDKFFYYNTLYSKGAKMPRGDKEKIMQYSFFIPPLKIQTQIVEVLDKFTELISDTKGLLPKEIALRQKQYEYYRGKLLAFK